MDRIESFQDLLDILDAKPEGAQAFRHRLLTPELLVLPENFAAFADMVEKRFQALKTDMTQVKADVAELKGHAVLVAAQRMTRVTAHAANVRHSRWLDSTQIVDIADDAEDEGKANIPASELQSFKAIDLAMTAIDKASGESCYVVIECSYTLTQDDGTRVKRNAAHMTRFTGITAKAMAAGNSIPEAVSTFAEDKDVACVTITSKASSPR